MPTCRNHAAGNKPEDIQMNMIRTDAEAKSILKAAGMSISKREGEYRVSPSNYTFPQYTPQEREAVAYYTDNREDAVSTGQHIAAQLKNGRHPSAYVERMIESGQELMLRNGLLMIAYGLTGPDWEPTAATKYYAQGYTHGGLCFFAPTYSEAIQKLIDAVTCAKHDADKAAQDNADDIN